MHNTLTQWIKSKRKEYDSDLIVDSFVLTLLSSLPEIADTMKDELIALVEKDCPKEIVLPENHELNGKTIHDWEGQDLFLKGQNVQYQRIRTAINNYFEKRV